MATTLAPTAVPHQGLRCPKCAAEMVTYERSGIHLDQCRECRGMFLDRGELERLVDAEGSAGWTGPQAPAWMPAPPRSPNDAGYRSDWHSHDDDGRGRWERDRQGGRPARRRNLLSDLLESFGE